MALEELIERSRQRTRELQQIGKRYNERDPEERKRFRRTIKLAVYDAEHRRDRYMGRIYQARSRPWQSGRGL